MLSKIAAGKENDGCELANSIVSTYVNDVWATLRGLLWMHCTIPVTNVVTIMLFFIYAGRYNQNN